MRTEMLESQLTYLEQCSPPKNDFWKHYLEDRAPAIQAEIDRLRRFANKRAGRVADNVNANANAFQARLDACLAINPPSPRGDLGGAKENLTMTDKITFDRNWFLLAEIEDGRLTLSYFTDVDELTLRLESEMLGYVKRPEDKLSAMQLVERFVALQIS